MRNSKVLLGVLTTLICLSLSCRVLTERFTARDSATGFIATAQLAPPDLKGTLVSPGAYVIHRLAEMDPSLAPLAERAEATERRAMQKIIAANTNTGEKLPLVSRSDAGLVPHGGGSLPLAVAAPAVLMFQETSSPLPGGHEGVLIAELTGIFKSMLAGVEAGDYHKRSSKTEADKETGGTTTMDLELDVGEDGSTGFGFGVQTDSVKNGVKVTTELKAKIDGQDCPNEAGQVPITVKMRLTGHSGTTTFTQEVTAFIRLVVDDTAEIAETTIDVTQGTTRGQGGQDVYVESGVTVKYGNDISKATYSNLRLVQQTDNATFKDQGDLSESGHSTAYGAALGAIDSARRAWQNGGCVKIQAESPGTVAINSSTAIPVKIIHKKDGSEITGKLEASLQGEASIDPKVIAKTAGTLTYVAPPDVGKSATISLNATSRRGRAKLDLMANTGGMAYQIVGGLDDWQTNTKVCDLMKPFVLTGLVTMNFSGGLSGTYRYSGGPFNANGAGTYRISLPDGIGKPGTMIGGGSGQVTGDKVYTGSGTEKYTLTPIEPCE